MQQDIKKGMRVVYHNERSCLDNVIYNVTKVGSKKITLEPVYGQPALIGLPTFRAPFNIDSNDLQAAITEGIYTIK